MKRIPLPTVPNGWYKAVDSDRLAVGAVLPLSILDRELVVFRGEDGLAHVLDGYCPHLGAHLGHGGQVTGASIACPFHGWRWDGADGRCLAIPYTDRIPDRARIRTYPIRELNGYVAFWFHALGQAPNFEMAVIPETADAGYRLHNRVRWEVASHVQEIYENVVDVAHFRSLHKMDVKQIVWEPVGGADAPVVRLYVDMVRDSASQSGADGETRIESFMYGPGLQVTRLSGRMRGVSVNSLTPLSDEQVAVEHAYYVERSDPSTEKEVEAFWDFYMQDHYLDFQIWNHKRFLERPMLAAGDGDVAMFRRWFGQFYSGSEETT